ncbi:hypothetical protein, partial [Klebsiella variicola]
SKGVGDHHTQQLLLYFLARRDVEQSTDYQLPARVTQPWALFLESRVARGSGEQMGRAVTRTDGQRAGGQCRR